MHLDSWSISRGRGLVTNGSKLWRTARSMIYRKAELIETSGWSTGISKDVSGAVVDLSRLPRTMMGPIYRKRPIHRIRQIHVKQNRSIEPEGGKWIEGESIRHQQSERNSRARRSVAFVTAERKPNYKSSSFGYEIARMQVLLAEMNPYRT